MNANQQAAAQPEDAANMQNLTQAESALGGALSRLMVVVEQYPDLKANQNMMQLTEELTTTENRIAFARQAYNDSVNIYNTYRQTFPPVAIAGMFGFHDAAFFEVDSEEEKQAPQVSFS